MTVPHRCRSVVLLAMMMAAPLLLMEHNVLVSRSLKHKPVAARPLVPSPAPTLLRNYARCPTLSGLPLSEHPAASCFDLADVSRSQRAKFATPDGFLEPAVYLPSPALQLEGSGRRMAFRRSLASLRDDIETTQRTALPPCSVASSWGHTVGVEVPTYGVGTSLYFFAGNVASFLARGVAVVPAAERHRRHITRWGKCNRDHRAGCAWVWAAADATTSELGCDEDGGGGRFPLGLHSFGCQLRALHVPRPCEADVPQHRGICGDTTICCLESEWEHWKRHSIEPPYNLSLCKRPDAHLGFKLEWGLLMYAAAIIDVLYGTFAPVYEERVRNALALAKGGRGNDACIALHVRHGDACVERQVERACPPLSVYLEMAEVLIQRYHLPHRAFLATDDAEVVAAARSPEVRARWNISFIANDDRMRHSVESLWPSSEEPATTDYKRTRHIEDRLSEDLGALGRFPLDGMLRDIRGLATCDYFVGDMHSNAAKLSYGLMAARLGSPPPFVATNPEAWIDGLGADSFMMRRDMSLSRELV